MKTLSIYDIKGKAKGKLTLDQTYFDDKVNKSLLHQSVRQYLANQRLGCACTKSRDKIRGGGRKPWRQKGTGRARVGSIRNPLWRGGGVVFGPLPRSFKYNLPKQIKRQALRHSLSSKIRDNQLLLVDNISLDKPKTKELAKILTALKARGKILIVTEKYNPNISRAGRNILGATVKPCNQITALDVLRHQKIIFSKPALESLVKDRDQ